MKHPIHLFSPLFLLFLLLSAPGMGPNGVEARTCESRSKWYKGRCTRSGGCAITCLFEGFKSGYCRGIFFRRCYCLEKCHPPPHH